MFVFKILLIILIALPVVALGTYFYLQILNFIREKNKLEQEGIRKSIEEPGVRTGKSSANRKKNGGKDKKKRKKKKIEESGQQK